MTVTRCHWLVVIGPTRESFRYVWCSLGFSAVLAPSAVDSLKDGTRHSKLVRDTCRSLVMIGPRDSFRYSYVLVFLRILTNSNCILNTPIRILTTSTLFRHSPLTETFRSQKHSDSNSNSNSTMDCVLTPTVDTTRSTCSTMKESSSAGGGSNSNDHMLNVQQILALKRSCAFPTSLSSSTSTSTSTSASTAASTNTKTPNGTGAGDAAAIAISAARKRTLQREWITALTDTKAILSDSDSDSDDYYSNDSDDSDHDSDDSEDDDDNDDDDEQNQETVVAKKAMVQAVFSRTLSAPTLDCAAAEQGACDEHEPVAKRARLESSFSVERAVGDGAGLGMGRRLPMVDSAPVLTTTTTATSTATNNNNNNNNNSTSRKNMTKPDDCLRSLLAEHGASTRTFSALDNTTQTFFLPVTAQSIEAYDMQVVQAVRNSDIATLRQLLKSGRTLQCGNKFGESIVHTCCRRGNVDVLKFLLQEAGVSCRVTCDYGRTPLHDACWTSTPNFELVDLLLQQSPDLLHVTDVRGFLPLAYVRQEHWDDWCHYLQSKVVVQNGGGGVDGVVQQLAARELGV